MRRFESATAVLFVAVSILVPTMVSAGDSPEDDEVDVVVLTPYDAIERARSNSHEIRIGAIEVEESELAFEEARRRRLPEVNLEGQYLNNVLLPVMVLPADSPFGAQVLETGTQHNVEATAQASIPIYSPQLNRNVDLADVVRQLDAALQEATVREIEIEVQRAFVNALVARESLEVLQESRQTLEHNLELVESMYEEDAAPEYDLIRTEVQVANLQPELTGARHNYEGALNYLKLLTGISMGTVVELDEELDDFYRRLPGVDYEPDFDDNPELIQLDGQRRIADAQVDVERASYLPTLSAFGNFTYRGQGDDIEFWDYEWTDTAAVGLALSIPLFSPGRRQRLEQARAEYRRATLQREFVRESLHADYQTTTNRIEELGETIAAQRRNVEQAERGFEIAQVSYEEGAYSLKDVNDAEEALTEARLNHSNVVAEYINAVLDLEELVGTTETTTVYE